MNRLTVEVLIILLLVAFNGLLALSEIALVSARKTRLQRQASQGDQRARLALELSNAPGRFLSTVQVGITLVGILAGTFGGATIAGQLADRMRSVPQLAAASDAIAIAVVVVSITLLSVVLGELVPKRLALGNPERLAAAVARPMDLLSKIAYPVVWFLEHLTDAILRLLRVRPTSEPPVTEEEVRMMVEQGAQLGIFEKAESEMVKAVFRLADKPVEMLMIPRSDIDWLNIDQPLEELSAAMRRNLRSRYPVCQASLDNVLGIVEARHVLGECLQGHPFDLRALLQPPLYVPNSATSFTLLEAFRGAQTHTALVVDEYGSILGLVTPYDLTKAVFGHLPQAAEVSEAPMIQRPDGSWLIDASVPVDVFKDTLDIEHLPQEETGYMTLAGFLLTRLGRIPNTGDMLEEGGLRYEIADMDAHRIDKVIVTPLPPDAAAPDENAI